jgi:DNA-binding transcriptional LysR family regulator
MRPTPPDIESLQLLTLIADLGSLGRAAEQMRISQPAASKRLTLLERRLALHLVDRGARGSTLTTEGKAVCQWSERVLAEVESLLAGAVALRAVQDNDLRLAGSMTLAEHFLPRWIGTLQRQTPDIRVSLKVTNSEQVAALAARGQIGLGFTEAPTVPRGLSSRQVAADRLAVVVAPSHRWARRRDQLPLAELAATPLIVREPGSGTRETLDRIFARAGIRPVAPLLVLEVNAAVRRAVAAGIGPAVLSAVTVEDDLALGYMVEIPIADVNLRRRLRAVWPKGQPLVGAADALLRIALHHPSSRYGAVVTEIA